MWKGGRKECEGSRPEWCISSMIYSRDTPFWSESHEWMGAWVGRWKEGARGIQLHPQRATNPVVSSVWSVTLLDIHFSLWRSVLLFLDYVTPHQHAVDLRDGFAQAAVCPTEMESSPSTDRTTSSAWQGSHYSTSF